MQLDPDAPLVPEDHDDLLAPLGRLPEDHEPRPFRPLSLETSVPTPTVASCLSPTGPVRLRRLEIARLLVSLVSDPGTRVRTSPGPGAILSVVRGLGRRRESECPFSPLLPSRPVRDRLSDTHLGRVGQGRTLVLGPIHPTPDTQRGRE